MPGSFTQRMARKASSAPALGAKLGISFPSGSNLSAERSERSKRFAARGPANSRLSLTDHHSSDVGTVKELDDAVRGARQQLQNFALTLTPKPTVYRAFYFGNCVYTFRFLLQRGAMSRPMRRNAAQAADWPRLAEAWGSQMCDLALRAASGEPAGRSLSQLDFAM